MKPITPQKITEELENLRNPIAPADCGRLRVQTFGNFEVFADGQALRFKYSKTLELLAYLVDRRGALCTNNELMAVLWGDEVNESYFKKLRSDLSHTFAEQGYGDVLVKQWGKLGISAEKLSCDYYDWTAGKLQAINAYQGEYMTQYSWAEATLGKMRSEL
jgi:two-component system, LytTR family, response regulator